MTAHVEELAALAAEVRARRYVLGLSVREAAKAVGIPTATFHRCEMGSREPRMSAYLALRRWLDGTEPEVSAIAFDELVVFS